MWYIYPHTHTHKESNPQQSLISLQTHFCSREMRRVGETEDCVTSMYLFQLKSAAKSSVRIALAWNCCQEKQQHKAAGFQPPSTHHTLGLSPLLENKNSTLTHGVQIFTLQCEDHNAPCKGQRQLPFPWGVAQRWKIRMCHVVASKRETRGTIKH